MIVEKNKVTYHLLALLVLIYFIVFLKLNSFHMRWWDESMFAVNTYEMLHQGKFFTPYFNSIPDLYNTKPPLTCWIQLIFVKIAGYNELAIRLPSAIAAALCILLVFKFIATRYSIIWAWLSALVLLTSPGFITFHTARTGDADSLLTFFLLAATIYFLKYMSEDKKKYIFIFFAFISLAFATKMFAALLFSPAYLLLLIHQKKLKLFIFNKAFVSGSILLFFVAIGLAYLREQEAPGYASEIFFKDAGRVFKVVENHREPLNFYLENLYTTRFANWYILLIAGCFFSFFSESKQEKMMLLLLILVCLVYLLIITVSITKLIWYDMPLYPYFAIIASYPIYLLIQKNHFYSLGYSKQTVLLIVLLFIYPYRNMFERSQANTLSSGEKTLEANERYIFEREHQNKNFEGIKVYYSGYERSLFFYKYKLADKGQKIELVTNGKFNVNDKVLVCNDSLKLLLSKQYRYQTIDQYEQALLLQLTEKFN